MWFPVNDHPVDRATYTFHTTVPAGYRVVANGIRESVTIDGRWKTHTWQATDPMISYCVTMDIGDFDLRFSETASGLPVIDAVDPDLDGAADASLARQPEIIGFLEGFLGPYPFASAGAIAPASHKLLYSLETQTRPIYAWYVWNDRWADYTVVHEIAHQWLGDLVAIERWEHIWLNEGFASYAEWMWSEREGFDTAQQIFDSHNLIPIDSGYWDLAIGDPGPDHLFDGQVYSRGAATLHALRVEVGDADFFRILRTWSRTEKGGTVTTREFIRLAERLSGEDLANLFDEWLSAGKPAGLPEPPPEPMSTQRRTTASERGDLPAALQSLSQRLKGRPGNPFP
jgi:aminopeptidase N